MDEDSLPHRDTFYAKTKLAAEQIVLDANTQEGEPIGTVLRFGAIYGSRIKSNYSRLLKSLAHGKFIPIGKGRNRRTLIYDRDVARAAVLAAEHPAAAGKIFNVSDGQFHKLTDIIRTICKALGRTPPRLSIPVAPARFMAGLMEDAFRLVSRKSPISRDTIEKYTEDISVDSQLIQRELGFKPQFDLESGWRETIRRNAKNGPFVNGD